MLFVIFQCLLPRAETFWKNKFSMDIFYHSLNTKFKKGAIFQQILNDLIPPQYHVAAQIPCGDV